MDLFKDKVVVVTGASSGIGEAIVRQLEQRGAKLVIGARREGRLQALAAELGAASVTVCETDVTQRDSVNALVEAALSQYGRIDVLINNAGVMPLSFLSQAKVDEWDQMIDVNIKGVLYGIAAALGPMRAQKSGHIINVASIAGHTVFPTGSVYCATKHAVRALSEGLRQEEQLIRTTVVSPGYVATELPNSISDARLNAATQQVYEEALEASHIANAVVGAIEQPPEVDVNAIVIRPVTQQQ